MESDIFTVIEDALTRAGYEVIGEDKRYEDGYSIVIRHPNSDFNYSIRVEELAP
jgi:hypothetical protein